MPDIVTNVLYAEIDQLRARVKELEAALAAVQGEVERLRETLDDIAHVGNYEASQRAIDALKEAKGECHHLTTRVTRRRKRRAGG